MDTLKVMVASGVTAVVVVALLMVTGAFKGESLQGVPGVQIIPYPQNIVQGGGIYATSTPTNSTLLTEAIDSENVIDHTLTQGSGTLTLMSSSSVPGIPNPGDSRTIFVRHATTTAGVNLTLAVGTGMTLKNAASSTVLLIGDTDGDNTMMIDLVRKSDTDINVYMRKYQD